MRSSTLRPVFLRRSWIRRTISRARPSSFSSSVISVSSRTSGAPNVIFFTFNSSRTIAATSSGSGSPGSAIDASGCRTLMRTASRAASPASTACLARDMFASTSGSCQGSACGKSLRWTEVPCDRLRNIESDMNGTKGAIRRLVVDSVSCSVWYAASLSRSDCDFQKRRRDRRTYQLDRSSTNRWIFRAGSLAS